MNKMKMTKLVMTLLLWLGGMTMAWGQVVEISGVVKDTDGEPLPGVAVMVKGTTTGVVTQVDGTYLLQTIKPDKTTVFVFSFMGFKTEERHYDGNNSINVVMEEEVKKWKRWYRER